jgi:hypothetical protein
MRFALLDGDTPRSMSGPSMWLERLAQRIGPTILFNRDVGLSKRIGIVAPIER